MEWCLPGQESINSFGKEISPGGSIRILGKRALSSQRMMSGRNQESIGLGAEADKAEDMWLS
jgi:hypothetical protein